jgi:fructokinase
MVKSLAGYIALPDIAEDSFVVPPALGGNAGPLGAVVLGQQAFEQRQKSFTAP